MAEKNRYPSISVKATFTFLFLLFSFLFSISGADPGPFDYSDYEKFLKNHVVRDKQIGEYRINVVDYEGIHGTKDEQSSLYRRVLSRFAEFEPESLATRESKVAFWINAYNMGAIKLIIDNYPVGSIRSGKINLFKNPWGKKILAVGGKRYSLGEIEHEILLGKLEEPMAHFAIVCASLSCPELIPDPYTGATVTVQLEEQARRFLRDGKRGLRIDREERVVYFSKIFKFDRKTFPNGAEDAIPLIEPFLTREDRDFLISGDYKRKYLDYDWSLNTLGSAR